MILRPRRRQAIQKSIKLSVASISYGLAINKIANAATSQASSLRTMAFPEPIAQIVRGGPTGLLAIGKSGTLYAAPKELHSTAAQILGKGLDHGAPIATGHGRIAARTMAGALWVLENGKESISQETSIAPHGGFCILPFGIIAIVRRSDKLVDAGRFVAARFEPLVSASQASPRWRAIAQSAVEVTPDAQPIQVALDPSGDDGQIIVMAGPNKERYPHAVLGDDIEPTSIIELERHSLSTLRELNLSPPFVFEDIAPRAVAYRQSNALLTMQSGPKGAQLVLVAPNQSNAAKLMIVAIGEPIGIPNRWMSPLTNGNQIASIHTPHIGGVLHEYKIEGAKLIGLQHMNNLTNHRIGSRLLNMASWIENFVWMPDHSRTQLKRIDTRNGWQITKVITLPEKLSATVQIGHSTRLAILLDSGLVLDSGT